MLGDFDPADHDAEAAARWPQLHEVSQQLTAGYSKSQWQQAVAEGDAIAAQLAELMASGAAADDETAMALAEEHRLSIDRWFYPCSHQIHSGLADLYLADPRFTQYWEDRREGLARWVRDAIHANAQR